MSNSSNNQGRAYEYVWMQTLSNALKSCRVVHVVENSSLEANRSAWDLMSSSMQKIFETSASAALGTILELEPQLVENMSGDLFLEFQQDKAGVKGDVRDIVIKNSSGQWEIGLSIKHNHEAIKHSRLSHALDFGQEWFGIPCGKNYWRKIKPVFNDLKEKKEKNINWSEISQKEETVYIPLLKAFMSEIQRAYKSDKTVPRKMVEYLIGAQDYYKIISQDNKQLTVIRTFNLHGTLNKPGRIKISSITVPLVKLPTEIISLKIKTGSKNTVEMYLNNGWELSFRIHNASTKVEPSLKFDIQFIGMPLSILTIECKWK